MVDALADVITPVILCGGAGTRLWPVSRETSPKQLHALVTDRSLLAETVARVTGEAGVRFGPPLVIANAAYAEAVRAGLGATPDARFIWEPKGRNTAPAAAVAALRAAETDPDALVLLLPADHHIADVPAFHAAIVAGARLAREGRIVTFGVTPDAPETGYGYIERGAALGDGFAVAAFHEKPNRETAERYLADGRFSWNAGIFLFRAAVFLDELARWRPDIREAAERALGPGETLNAHAFAACPSDSIDYAVMEKTDRAAVVPVAMGWSDVGSWNALWEATAKDADGLAAVGDVTAVDCADSYLRAQSRLVAGVGLKDMIVVETPDAVFVAPRDRSQDVKTVVAALRKAGRHEATHAATPPSAPEPVPSLQAMGESARAWLFDACFPFWAERAADPRRGFRERLTLDGAPILDASSRVRVQARQTYVFAQAALLGWEPPTAKALVARGVETLLNDCRRTDGVFGAMLDYEGGLADDRADLYNTAFGIFALSWAARALEDDALITLIDATFDALDAHMAHPAGGYRTGLASPSWRRQNPHMHLFEASLAAHAASGADRHLARADALFELARDRFIDPETGRLREAFAQDWTPAPSPDGDAVEPGHEFEWVWLSAQHAHAHGASLPKMAHGLYAHALNACDARGFAPQVIDAAGRPLDPTRRTWPQTEALKAHIVMARHGDGKAEPRARALFANLSADYLCDAPAGGWRDHFDASGRRLSTDMTASTGYHLVMAMTEAMRFADESATEDTLRRPA